MKVIVIVLAVAASVAARDIFHKIKAQAAVHHNSRIAFDYVGTLTFSQAIAGENITVTGTLWGLEPAQYVVVVHEGTETPGDCNDLGPVQEVDGRFFHLFYVTMDESKFVFIKKSLRATLIPNQPRTIVDRTIGIYDVQKFNYYNGISISPSAACGEIVKM